MEALTNTVPSRSRERVIRIPLLRDYWNLRAAPRTDGDSIGDVLKVAVPTILAAVLTGAEQITKLLTFAPNTARIVQALLPTACTIVCVYIICRTSPMKKVDPPAGFVAHAHDEGPLYAFSSGARNTAKVLFPVLAIIAVAGLNEIAPNVGGRRILAGYICRLDNGAPIGGSDIDVLNVSAQSAAQTSDIVGDDGFFAIQLRTWAGRPRVLRLRARGCQAEDIDLTRSQGESTCCPGATPDPTRRREYPLWTIACRPSAP